jgi:hypothetical protein
MRQSRAEIHINGHTYVVTCVPNWGSIEKIDRELVDILYSWTKEFEDFGTEDMIALIDAISMSTQLDHLDGLFKAFMERGLISPLPPEQD